MASNTFCTQLELIRGKRIDADEVQFVGVGFEGHADIAEAELVLAMSAVTV